MREIRKRNDHTGSESGLTSFTKNRKLTSVIGIALIAVGVLGLVSIGADALETIRIGEYTPDEGAEFRYAQYVFMFTMIGGLIILIYSGVAIQAEKARARMKPSNLEL